MVSHRSSTSLRRFLSFLYPVSAHHSQCVAAPICWNLFQAHALQTFPIQLPNRYRFSIVFATCQFRAGSASSQDLSQKHVFELPDTLSNDHVLSSNGSSYIHIKRHLPTLLPTHVRISEKCQAKCKLQRRVDKVNLPLNSFIETRCHIKTLRSLCLTFILAHFLKQEPPETNENVCDFVSVNILVPISSSTLSFGCAVSVFSFHIFCYFTFTVPWLRMFSFNGR